jgi:RNA-binding protein
MTEKMITTKQRAYLRTLSNSVEALYQTGKNGITETVLKTLNDALEARELIKITVQEASPESPKEIMNILTEKLNCAPVQVIGRRVVVYRASKDDPKITLPEK